MRRVLACASVITLAVAAPATAALPRAGTLVPGRSLGGIRLGEPAPQVRAALGGFFGVCSDCSRRTWYFTYRPFDSRGLGVELTKGRVTAVYTVWQPSGWHGPQGLVLGQPASVVDARLGKLLPVACAGYSALVDDTPAARTAYYVVNGRLWGFGLLDAKASPCR